GGSGQRDPHGQFRTPGGRGIVWWRPGDAIRVVGRQPGTRTDHREWAPWLRDGGRAMVGWDLALRRGKERAGRLHPRDLVGFVIIIALLSVFVIRAAQSNLIGNLHILAMWMATLGIVSIGQTLVVLTGGVDLSVGSLMALTGVITSYLTTTAVSSLLGPFSPW